MISVSECLKTFSLLPVLPRDAITCSHFDFEWFDLIAAHANMRAP